MRKAQSGYGWDGGVVVSHIRHVTQPRVSVKLLGRGINPEKGFVCGEREKPGGLCQVNK